MSDGRDIEFSRELADQDDLEALERSKAADERMKSKPPMKKTSKKTRRHGAFLFFSFSNCELL
ncbi:hypothetical protein GCM10020331_050860 [Ectobacillus funiculus]